MEDKEEDGEVPEGVSKEERDKSYSEEIEKEVQTGDRGKVVCVDVREKVPRDFYITYEDAQRCKQYTKGCPGCSSW